MNYLNLPTNLIHHPETPLTGLDIFKAWLGMLDRTQLNAAPWDVYLHWYFHEKNLKNWRIPSTETSMIKVSSNLTGPKHISVYYLKSRQKRPVKKVGQKGTGTKERNNKLVQDKTAQVKRAQVKRAQCWRTLDKTKLVKKSLKSTPLWRISIKILNDDNAKLVPAGYFIIISDFTSLDPRNVVSVNQ